MNQSAWPRYQTKRCHAGQQLMTETVETGAAPAERRALSACFLIALAAVGGVIQLVWVGFLLWIVLGPPLSIVARAIF